MIEKFDLTHWKDHNWVLGMTRLGIETRSTGPMAMIKVFKSKTDIK